MTTQNEHDTSQLDGTTNGTIPMSTTTLTNTNTPSGIVIVQQQPVSEQPHFILSAVNNPAPMIITTPLGRERERDYIRYVHFDVRFSCTVNDYSTIANNSNYNQWHTTSDNSNRNEFRLILVEYDRYCDAIRSNESPGNNKVIWPRSTCL